MSVDLDYFKKGLHKLPSTKDLAKYKQEYRKKYYSINKSAKLAANLRSRINYALKGKFKADNSLALLGCTKEELIEHLEGQFKDGMNWENYGFQGWHMDHIKPCSAFNLEDPEEQKKCFHYTNLQPLWAEDNFKKNDNF